jgi:hypothetical protein
MICRVFAAAADLQDFSQVYANDPFDIIIDCLPGRTSASLVPAVKYQDGNQGTPLLPSDAAVALSPPSPAAKWHCCGNDAPLPCSAFAAEPPMISLLHSLTSKAFECQPS